jgi:hypothetical protein
VLGLFLPGDCIDKIFCEIFDFIEADNLPPDLVKYVLFKKFLKDFSFLSKKERLT